MSRQPNQPRRQLDEIRTARQSGGLLLRGTRTHASQKHLSPKRQRQQWRQKPSE